MTLVCSLVVALLLCDATIAGNALSTERRGHETRNGHTACSPQQDNQDHATEASEGAVLLSSSSLGDRGGAASPNPSRPQDLYDSLAHRDCIFTHTVYVPCLVLLLLAIGTWSLARWWRCCARGLQRSPYSVDDASGEENDGVARNRDAAMARRGLLSGRQNSPRDAPGSVSAMHGAARSGSFGFRNFFHASNVILPAMRLWGVLQHTTVGIFGTPAQLAGSIVEPDLTQTMVVDCGEGSTDNVMDSCNRSRDAKCTASISTPASDRRPHTNAELFLKTTTASSDDSNDRSTNRDAKSFEDSMCDRRCSCESDSSSDAHAEVERPALRGAATEWHWCPFYLRADIISQPTHFDITVNAKEQILSCDVALTGKDGQQACDGLVTTTRSTASDASGESSSHTPPPPTDTPELSRCDSGSSVCAGDADTFGNSLCTRAALPHVDTAIFDAEVTHHASLGSAGSLHGGGCSSPALPCCEAICSRVGSYISDLEYLAPPSAHASTAAPSPALHSAPFLPLNGSIGAALPCTGSLNSGLSTLDEELMKGVVKSSAPSPSYVPTLQLQLSPDAEPPKRRSKRRSARYCEPWQPVLVVCKAPPLDPAAAAAKTSVSMYSTPDSPVCYQAQQNPVTQEVGNDRDDLMLAHGSDSAQSSSTGGGTRVFSGRSSTALCPLTPVVETKRDTAKMPLVLSAVYRMTASLCSNLAPRIPLATASIPLRPTSPLLDAYSRTASAPDTRLSKRGEYSSGERCRLSHIAGQRPGLNLSVEERKLLLRSRNWLFPLIDGTDEIEQDDEGSSRQYCPS